MVSRYGFGQPLPISVRYSGIMEIMIFFFRLAKNLVENQSVISKNQVWSSTDCIDDT
jgi:hypothetical protein